VVTGVAGKRQTEHGCAVLEQSASVGRVLAAQKPSLVVAAPLDQHWSPFFSSQFLLKNKASSLGSKTKM
jgi:hypothetical protein